MDLKKGKAFLNSPRRLQNKIRRLQYEIEELKTSLEPSSVRYDLDRVKSTPKDLMPETFAKIDELERELKRTQEEKRRIIRKIKDYLSALPESPEKVILYGYDVCGKQMEEISNDLNYSVKHCYNLRNKGIKQLKEPGHERTNH